MPDSFRHPLFIDNAFCMGFRHKAGMTTIWGLRNPPEADCNDTKLYVFSSMLKRISLYVMSAFYMFAGVNHFRNPEFYAGLIPPYLPNPDLINTASGVAEILLGALLLFSKTRKIAAVGIIAMLIAFVPAHVYHIQTGGCPTEELCAPLWATWVRLLVLQPLLIVWAWWNRK